MIEIKAQLWKENEIKYDLASGGIRFMDLLLQHLNNIVRASVERPYKMAKLTGH